MHWTIGVPSRLRRFVTRYDDIHVPAQYYIVIAILFKCHSLPLRKMLVRCCGRTQNVLAQPLLPPLPPPPWSPPTHKYTRVRTHTHLHSKAIGDRGGRLQITPTVVSASGLSRHDLFDNKRLKERLNGLSLSYTEWEQLEIALKTLDEEVRHVKRLSLSLSLSLCVCLFHT